MSGTVIITKHALVGGSASPAADVLARGELAYAFNGEKLFIGNEAAATEAIVIGGKYFTDMLDHTLGTLTASSALLVDANSKIDLINIDNITINGNSITTTNNNGNLIVNPHGTGEFQVTANTAITGTTTISSTLGVSGESTLASAIVSDLTATRLVFAGTDGALVDDANLAWTSNVLYVTGALDVDNIMLDGNAITSTDTNGDISITPDGTGDVIIGSANGVLQIPNGTDGTRKAATAGLNGSIRYNTTSNIFEGVVSGVWKGLGGVEDEDQDTYITAEATSDDDTLTFVTADDTEMTITTTGVGVNTQITSPIVNATVANIGTSGDAAAGSLTVHAAAVDFKAGIDVTGGNVDITANLNVAGNTIMTGDLTVNGTTTSVNSTITELSDPVIKVGKGSALAGDSKDRGINFDWGNGTAVKSGFFGMDMQTSRFSFKPDATASDDNYSASWGVAQFGGIYLGSSGQMVVDNTGKMTAGTIDCGTF